MTQARRPSPLQKRVLIVLAALDAKRPGPVATRDIERLLEQGGDMPVYGPNLRASCRRMEAAGWLRTLRAKNLQLAVELTDSGRELAAPLLAAEQAAEAARQQAATVLVLPGNTETQTAARSDVPVYLDGTGYLAWRADFVLRLDGGTCLQLWDVAGQMARLEGDPLQVARWSELIYRMRRVNGINFPVTMHWMEVRRWKSPEPVPRVRQNPFYRLLHPAQKRAGR